MEYGFDVLCEDLLEKLQARMISFNKAVTKDFNFALNVINNYSANKARTEINVEISDILDDQHNKCILFYAETFNKIKRMLIENIK